jgi:hypothetical protein
MRLVLVLLAATLSASFAAAQETLGSMGFGYLNFQQMRQMLPAGAPSLAGKAAGQALTVSEDITNLALLPQATKKNLIAFPTSQDDNQAFLDKWTAILAHAGFTPGANDYQPGSMSVLPYTGNGGLAVREFLADPAQFKPKDPADLQANMQTISGLVQKAGLPIIASFTSSGFDFYLPTYHLYYLTDSKEQANQETQVRILKAEGVDAAIFAKAGVQVLQQVMATDDSTNIMTVYIGKEVGMVTRSADTRADVDAKVADFQKAITDAGGSFIQSVVRELPPGSYRNFEFDLYFFQAPQN